jgi:hypothetical protein
MSASLIGRFGSSAFRLSTTSVSMSLTGSRFSPESALGPFHHGNMQKNAIDVAIRGKAEMTFCSAHVCF